MTTAETVHRLIDQIYEQVSKRGQVAAIKAKTFGLHGAELREALKTVAYYQRSLNRAVLEFYRGDMDASEFVDDMIRLVEGQFSRAWNEGSRAVGVDPKDHTEKDRAELQRRIDVELEFVLDYAQAIEDAKTRGDPVKPLQDRVSLWTNRYNELVSAAMIWFGARKKKRLKWVLGATEQHCGTCARLNGIVATAEDWQASGYKPQNAPNSMLECGGWKCDCRLEVTKEDVTEAQP